MASDAAPQVKTVVINWVETSHHRITVQVPVDFDADECDLGDALAEFSDDGFEGLERDVAELRVVEADPSAPFFDPPRF